MLSGKMAFPGDNITDILASVVKLEPEFNTLGDGVTVIEWNGIPPSTPLLIRKLITRCLAKDRKLRLQAIGEARVAIDDYLANPGAGLEPAVASTTTGRPRRPWLWIAIRLSASSDTPSPRPANPRFTHSPSRQMGATSRSLRYWKANGSFGFVPSIL